MGKSDDQLRRHGTADRSYHSVDQARVPSVERDTESVVVRSIRRSVEEDDTAAVQKQGTKNRLALLQTRNRFAESNSTNVYSFAELHLSKNRSAHIPRLHHWRIVPKRRE